MSPRSTLLLIDGNGLLYRAYFAFPPLTTPNGEPIGAVYGFCRILLAALRNLQPTHIAVSFDLAQPTFRHQAYSAYKATRQKMPDEMASQIEQMHNVVEHLEFPIYTAAGYEADDVLATLADQAASEEARVIILSGDQDLLQTVTPNIFVFSPQVGNRNGILYTPEKVREVYGFTPSQMIDYKALAGDSSDNVPGITGVGEVTAKKLLQEYGTLKQLYETIEQNGGEGLKPALLQKLTEQQEQAWLSYRLVTLDHQAPVQYDAQRCKLELQNPEKLVGLFEDLGFKSLIPELPKSHLLLSQAVDVFQQAMDVSSHAKPSPTPPPSPSQSEAIDQELSPVLRQMEEVGVKVDLPYLAQLEKEYQADIDRMKGELYDVAGQEFNPDSPSQVAHILYEVLHIPTGSIRKGKTGYTTDAATLQHLAHSYPIALLLLQYRELVKLQTTYVKPLQELVDERQRIHTSYAPDTSTGRISSKNPNLQNIPIRSEQGRRIRQAFITDSDKCLVAADYSQIELRIAAHLSQDPVMIQVFREGGDFHAETAERMKVDRRVAKIINFSILYGKGAYGFSQDLNISLAEARKYIEQYYATFAGLRRYLDQTLMDARQNGYVETMYGRRRYFPEINARDFQRRAAAEREAINLPIQGTAADILKLAMCRLESLRPQAIPESHLILTVHDELILEVPTQAVDQAAKLLIETMTTGVSLAVPLEVSVSSGLNWAEMKKVATSED